MSVFSVSVKVDIGARGRAGVCASTGWAPLRVPVCALGLQGPAVSLEQTHCPLALRRLKVPMAQSREQQGPPPDPPPSYSPSSSPAFRGGLHGPASRQGGPLDGERGQLNWGPRAEESRSQLVTSRGLPGMAPSQLLEPSLLGLRTWHVQKSPGAPVYEGAPTSQHPIQQKCKTTDTQHPSPGTHPALTPAHRVPNTNTSTQTPLYTLTRVPSHTHP